MDFDRLFLKRGEKPTSAHLRALDELISRQNHGRSIGVRRKYYPFGTVTIETAKAGGPFDAPVFRPDVHITGNVAQVRWGGPRALIGGVAPTIGDLEIFEADPRTRQRPALEVKGTDFGENGECGIYFKLTVDSADYRALTVTPVVKPKLPPREPFTAYPIALFLRLRQTKISYVEIYDRQLFSGQGFFAANRRPGGIFEPLFWATF